MSNDGGPAFPTTKPLYHWGDLNAGMTLRDWFAGQALGPLIGRVTGQPKDEAQQIKIIRELAEMSFKMADAMLAARATDTQK